MIHNKLLDASILFVIQLLNWKHDGSIFVNDWFNLMQKRATCLSILFS